MKPFSSAQRGNLIRWSNGGRPQADSNGQAFYEYKIVTVAQAVERTARGDWQLPEFQRAFVWNAAQVCDIADSLLRGYPLGVLLLWAGCPAKSIEPSAPLLIADGQQRLVSLCLMFGREPSWWRCEAGGVPPLLEDCDLRFDLEVTRPPFFKMVRRAEPPQPRLVPLARCLANIGDRRADEALVTDLVDEIKAVGGCLQLEAGQIFERLMRVRAIAQRPLATAIAVCDPDDLVEIFERLSGGGLRFRRLMARAILQSLPLRRRWLQSLLSLKALSSRQARGKPQVRNL
jgi:hypothetical protein